MWFTLLLTAVCSSSRLQEYSVPFMETSAKTGVNVELAFTAVSKYEHSGFINTVHYTCCIFSLLCTISNCHYNNLSKSIMNNSEWGLGMGIAVLLFLDIPLINSKFGVSFFHKTALILQLLNTNEGIN